MRRIQVLVTFIDEPLIHSEGQDFRSGFTIPRRYGHIQPASTWRQQAGLGTGCANDGRHDFEVVGIHLFVRVNLPFTRQHINPVMRLVKDSLVGMLAGGKLATEWPLLLSNTTSFPGSRHTMNSL